jgi:hypothetical protein
VVFVKVQEPADMHRIAFSFGYEGIAYCDEEEEQREK